MFNDYFGSVSDGRLGTRRFIMLWLVLIAGFVILGLLIGASIGVAERLIGGDVEAVRKTLSQNFGLPVIIALAVIFVAFAFANLNILAKRARDVGLPGWITAIVIAGLSGGVSQATGSGAVAGLGLLLTLILAFIPSNQFRRND